MWIYFKSADIKTIQTGTQPAALLFTLIELLINIITQVLYLINRCAQSLMHG